MELRQLSTFRMVAKTLSFTHAARELNYAQSTVTAQIRALEEELGIQLFERLGKRIVLTEEGQRFLFYAERLLQLAAEGREAVAGDRQLSSRLVIGAPESLCAYRLLDVLLPYHERFPHVQVIFHGGYRDELGRAVHDGLLDAAFFIDAPVQWTGLTVEQLIPEPMVIVASPTNPLTHFPEVLPADLLGEPILLTESGCGYRRAFERTLAVAGVAPASTLSFSSVEAMKQCIIAGMGIALLPRVAVAAEIAQGRLAALSWAGEEFHVVTQVAWHKDKWLSPALQAFLDMTRQSLLPPAQMEAIEAVEAVEAIAAIAAIAANESSGALTTRPCAALAADE